VAETEKREKRKQPNPWLEPEKWTSLPPTDGYIPEYDADSGKFVWVPAGGVGPAPAGTVVTETAFGQGSAVGSDLDYARGQHTHGTPTNPITAHEAAGDPHPSYLTPAEHTAVGDSSPHHVQLHAASHAEGAADTLVGQDVNVRRLRIEDIDGTPVGDIYLRVIDEVLEIRDATDAAYKPVKIADVNFQHLTSYATGSFWRAGASVASTILLQAYNGSGFETVAIIAAGSGAGTPRFQITLGKLTGQLDANSQRIINLLAPSAVTEPARKQELDDHAAAADPHTGYRLESADHTHQSTGAQAGQLDHGLALTGLLDDDHTQYQKESEKDGASGYAGLTAGAKLNLAQMQEVMAHADLTDSPADAHHNKQHPLTSTTEHSLSGATDGQKLAATGATTWAFEDDIETINFIIDGGGSAITTGQKGHVVVDFACTVVAWTILADQSGSIVVDVWKDTYANFPPTVADTITGTEKPTLASVQKNQDTSLTSWTTTIAAGDILAYNVDSAATVTRVVVALKVRRT